MLKPLNVKDKDSDKANEPTSPYGNRLVIDNSFADQEADNYLYWLSLTPEQRLAEATKLMEGIYKGVPRKKDNRIHFD